MTRELTYGDGFELLGRLITAAHGLDDSFMAEGRCALPEHRDPITGDRISPFADKITRKTIWQVDFNDSPVKGQASPRELIQVALMICHSCPVQYECAHYAVEAEIQAGTWSARLSNVKWMQRSRAKSHEYIDEAERAGVSVEKYITPIREAAERHDREDRAQKRGLAALIGTG